METSHAGIRALAALALLVPAACLRVVTPAAEVDAGTSAQPLPLGVRCAEDTACSSGFCVDGVCCEQRCAASQSCALPESAGSCARRPLGAACTAVEQCPTGHCVDGVCCDIACTGDCSYCAEPGFEGQCRPVPLNEDSRGACGVCQACFAGSCAPAIPGTNPRDACDAGLACNAVGACAVEPGGACTDASQCSTPRCAASMCLGYSVEPVAGLYGNPAAQMRRVHSVTVRPDGSPCAVMQEIQYKALPEQSGSHWYFTYLQDDYTVQCRTETGWLSTPWLHLADPSSDPGSGRMFSPITLLAPSWGLLLVVATGGGVARDTLEMPACGLVAQIFYLGNQDAGRRCLLAESQTAASRWMTFMLRDDRTVDAYVADSDATGSSTSIYHRVCTDFRCGEAKLVVTGSEYALPGVATRLGTHRALVDLPAEGGRLRVTLDEGTPVMGTLPAACTVGVAGYDSERPFRVVNALAMDDDELLVAVQCAGDAAAGYFRASTGAWEGIHMLPNTNFSVIDVQAVRLPQGRRAVLIRSDALPVLVMLDPAGDRIEYPPLPPVAGALERMDFLDSNGFPHVLLETVTNTTVAVEGSTAEAHTGRVQHVNYGPR